MSNYNKHKKWLINSRIFQHRDIWTRNIEFISLQILWVNTYKVVYLDTAQVDHLWSGLPSFMDDSYIFIFLIKK